MKRALRSRFEKSLRKFEKSADAYLRSPRASPRTSKEALHDMRVALRVLRTGARVAQMKKLEEKLKNLFRATSIARDEQVLATIFKGAKFAGWRSGLSKRRTRAEVMVRRKFLGKVPSEFADMIRQELDNSFNDACDSEIRRLARCSVKRDARKVAKGARKVKNHLNDPSFLHHIRIRAKRLRYTIALFSKELPKGDRRLQKTAEEVQDTLGRVHDLDVAIQVFSDSKRKEREAGLKKLREMRRKALPPALKSARSLGEEAE